MPSRDSHQLMGDRISSRHFPALLARNDEVRFQSRLGCYHLPRIRLMPPWHPENYNHKTARYQSDVGATLPRHQAFAKSSS
jgi:hypothetical protein